MSSEGSRACLVTVPFSKPFKKPPTVVTFIAGLEIVYENDHRLSVEAMNISNDDFMAQIGNALVLSSFCCSKIIYFRHLE